MKLAVEIGPLAVFFGTYVIAKRSLGSEVDGIIWATGTFIVASLVALLTSWRVEGRVQPTSLVTFVIVVLMGGLTIYLGDETFIKRKPTLVSGTLGAVLLGGLAVGRPLIKPLFGSTFALDDAGWRALTLRWGLFFLVLAVLNEIVWRNMSTDAWVNYKTFGILPLSLAFVAAQLPLIQRHSTESSPGPPTDNG